MSQRKRITYLPIQQFLLIAAAGHRGPDPIAPMLLAAAAILCAFTAALTL